MNYISKLILEVLEERFKEEEHYIENKKEELEQYKTKEETLTYLFTKSDEDIQAKVVTKMIKNGSWNYEDEIEEIIYYSQKLFRII